MHTNTATNCPSRYRIDETLVLTCNIPKESHYTNLRGDEMHKSLAFGVQWTWNDREADN